MVSKSRRRQSGDDGSNRSSSHEVQVKAAPHFFKIIHSSAVPHQKLRIPLKFISQYGKNVGNHVFLKVPIGAVWKIELERSNGVVWMCNGWKEFAKYYSIGFGHLLVFRYDGNCNFNVLIFDTSASEIEYQVSATHGEQTNINGNGNSKIHETEDVIEINDSVETLGDVPCATYNTKREEIYGRGEIEKLGIQTRQKTRLQASYYRANIEKDASVKILDDTLVRDSPVSERERANTKSGMENNMQEFQPDFQSEGLKLSNPKKDVQTEIETEEGAVGTSIGQRRHQSQIPAKMLSATANMNSRALERARDFKSKKPFFTVHMQPSYIFSKSSLSMPQSFVKKYLGDHRHKNVSLKISDGTIWSVRSYCRSMNARRSLAWSQFARDNNLKVGDVCIFELMSKVIEPLLNVTIFRK